MKPEVGKVRAEDIAAFLAKFDDVEEAIDAIRNFAQPAVSAGLVDLPPTAKSDSTTKAMPPPTAAPERSGRCHIAVTDLAKSYRVGRQTIPALGGVSLDIFAGEFVAITGASGSGKSTLLQLIGGLDKPSAGQILINDQPLSRLSDRQLSRFRSREIGTTVVIVTHNPDIAAAADREIRLKDGRITDA